MNFFKLLRNIRTPALRNRARLGVQTLEQRDNPSGIVAVTFANNTIILTGDGNANGNDVKITTTGNDNVAGQSHFNFEGRNGTQFRVNGGAVQGDFDTATVAGFNFPNNRTTKLVAKFGAGDDSLVLDGFERLSNTIFERSFGDMTIDLGAGNDNLNMNSFLAANFSANGGVGNDGMYVFAGGAHPAYGSVNGGISGKTLVHAGTGADTVQLSISTSKDVAVNASDAGDTILLNGPSRIGGSLLVNVASSPMFPGAKSTIGIATVGSGDVIITGDLTIRNGNNNIDLTTGQVGGDFVVVGRNVTVASGSDALTGSLYNLNNVNVGRTVSVTGGAGIDRLDNGFMNAGGTIAFNMRNGGNWPGDEIGSVVCTELKLVYGSGDDVVKFDGIASVQKNLSIATGAGNDTLQLDQFQIGGNLSVNTGAGNDLLNAGTRARFLVSGTSSFVTGGGNDTVFLTGSSRFLQKVTINMGGTGFDNDTLNMDPAAGEEMLMLKGLSVTGGSGLDLLMGGNGAGNLMVHNGVTVPGTFVFGNNFLTL